MYVVDLSKVMKRDYANNQHLISGLYAHLLAEVAADWNFTPTEIFWGTGIDKDQLSSLDYQITLRSFKKLISRLIELTKEEGIGFYAGSHLKISSHGLLGFTFIISKNLHDAIQTINKYINMICTFVIPDLIIDDNSATYYITYEKSVLDLKNNSDLVYYEFCISFFVQGFVNVFKSYIPDFAPTLYLQCKKPGYFSKYENLLSSLFSEVLYEQKMTAIVIPNEQLYTPLSLSDPLTSEKFKQLCQKELDELVATQDILYRVKQLIDDPIEGLLGIDQVAQKLNLTKRTLQRMLQEKSVSFQSLYDDVRKTKAQKLMLSPFASKDQIAKQLGYASTSSFNRAVKRWALE